MSNPLIFIPSPRSIPEFEDATDKLNADKLWLKFYPEEEAYEVARHWFLAHEEFTHLAILPDDLLVSEQDLIHLKQDSEYFDVINGWCRNTIRLTPWWTGEPEIEDQADTNISLRSLPPDPPIQGQYEDYQFESVESTLQLATVISIVPVLYAGFPFTFISRKIVEQVPFRRDGCCVDSCFALDLYEAGIKQYCDLRVRTVHMNRNPNEILVGKQQKEIIFEC